MSGSREKYVAGVDIGTTTMRCHIFNFKAELIQEATDQVVLIYPRPGWVEIDPEVLWQTFVKVVKEAISGAGLTAKDITCLGISTQRGTFVTWDVETGKPFHNFITWKDIRSDELVKLWNNSLQFRSLKIASKIIYAFTRSRRYLSASVLQFSNIQVTMRLLWALQNNVELKLKSQEGLARFGTVDTWILHKLSRGHLHVTDYSNISATGFYDPYVLDYGTWAFKMFGMPTNILPKVVDSCGDFGMTDPAVFGAEIPIRCVIADQGASLFGSCCFYLGDVKFTMGTGAFLNVNSGRRPHASVAGIYPVIGWKYGDDLTFVAEGSCSDTGTVINFGRSISLFDKPEESASLAETVDNCGGVYFIPAFSGLGAPFNDALATTGFLGLKQSTKKEHIVRALLESIAFRMKQLYDVMLDEADFDLHDVRRNIRVDGGVSRNNFVLQLVADLIKKKVERPANIETSALGAAFMAGLHSGVWKSKDELLKLRVIDREFHPQQDMAANLEQNFGEWERAVDRFCRWHQEDEAS